MGDDPLMVAPVGEIAQSLIIYLVDDGAVGFGLGDEFMGTIYRDDDEGDISYDFNMAILEMDLPPAA